MERTVGRIQRIGTRWAAVSVACACVVIGLLAPTADAASKSASNPLDGTGMWIWITGRSSGGSPSAIGAVARRYGVRAVYVKSSDGQNMWSQFTSSYVGALKSQGLKVCAWQYVYGKKPEVEARLGATAVQRGADCLIIDAESEYEGRYAQAARYIRTLRARIGPGYPLAVAPFPYVDYHPSFPYSVFLGPGAAQYDVPQMYWKAIGTSVDKVFAHTYAYNRLYGTTHVSLRYGNVFGPRQDPHGEAGVVAIFMNSLREGGTPKIFGDGSQTRDYVYVGDVVAASLAAVRQDGGVFNVGTGVETSVRDLYERVQGVSGITREAELAPPRPGELQRSVLDASLAQQTLGWKPERSLDEGLAETWASA